MVSLVQEGIEGGKFFFLGYLGIFGRIFIDVESCVYVDCEVGFFRG